mgnify:CR=1 FL=1
MRINVILENKMAYKEKEIEKLYYSIGEVSEMLSINASTIRYWEKEFDILKPKKNAKGDRFFTKEDIEKIRLIYRMLKEKGYTVKVGKFPFSASGKASAAGAARTGRTGDHGPRPGSADTGIGRR